MGFNVIMHLHLLGYLLEQLYSRQIENDLKRNVEPSLELRNWMVLYSELQCLML